MTTTTTPTVSRKVTKVNETWNETQPGVKTRSVTIELACGHSFDGDRGETYEIGTDIACKTCTAEEIRKAKAAAERAGWLNHCNEHVYHGGLSSYRGDWCSHKPKVVREVKLRTGGGSEENIETVKKAYCGQHDPVRIETKRNEEYAAAAQARRRWDKIAENAKTTAQTLMTWLPELGTISPVYRSGDGRRGGYYNGSVELTSTQVEKLIEKLQKLQQLEAAQTSS